MMLLWLIVPLVPAAVFLLLYKVEASEFDEVERRSRALRGLANQYDPEQDPVLKAGKT